MSIKTAMLGFLSWRPLSGYDLKKMFADSDFISWAGSNNQIYNTLVEMHREGLVTNEVQQPERGPSRKIYTITEQGLVCLKDWLRSAPQPPDLRNSFLLQLAWADQLAPEEVDGLLERYAREIEMQLLMAREHQRRGRPEPARTPRERYLWGRIAAYWISYYEHELAWVQETRAGLAAN